MNSIKGFNTQSLVDWDGKVSSVIFLSGCNFKCSFCSNRDLVNGELKDIDFNKIEDYLKNNKEFVDGVVITGGEPSLYPEIKELCKELKNLGFPIKIDSNGSRPEILKELIDENLVDFIAMDIKTSFENYEKITNTSVDIDKIKKSIEILRDFGSYEFRITMFPKVLEKDLIEISRYLNENKANKALFIQQFRPDECLDKEAEKEKPYTKTELERFCKKVQGYFEKCGLRNV